MKSLNFKKLLAAAISTPIIISSATTVMACSNKQPSVDVSKLVVQAINQVATYQVDILINEKKEALVSLITADFIKQQLNEKEQEIFDDQKFNFNNIFKADDQELTDEDLLTEGTIEAKINYNYDKFKNQNTKLTININENRLNLDDKFKDFQFKDQNNINGFLEAKDLDIITNQILVYINFKDLSDAGLILKEVTNNSIILKAKEDSKLYKGQVTLTWKLKLFEVWAQAKWGAYESVDRKIEYGLRGYLYLLNDKIKYFDVISYFKLPTKQFHSKHDLYHSFKFDDQNFVFNGSSKSNEIENKVNFSIKEGSIIEVKSPELDLIKVFANKEDFVSIGKRDEINKVVTFTLFKGKLINQK